jgi:hypothetical protein
MAWSRNFGRGPGQISVNLRVAKTIEFGAEEEGPRADPRPGPGARVLKMARGSTRRRTARAETRRSAERTLARIASDISKYTGQSVRPAGFGVNDLESDRLAGIFRVIWSNLCTRAQLTHTDEVRHKRASRLAR